MTDRPEKEIASSAVWLSEREREGEPRRRADAKGKPDSSSESQNGSGDATNCSHERNSPTKSSPPPPLAPPSILFLVESRKKAHAARFQILQIYGPAKTERGGGRGSRSVVERKSNGGCWFVPWDFEDEE